MKNGDIGRLVLWQLFAEDALVSTVHPWCFPVENSFRNEAQFAASQ